MSPIQPDTLNDTKDLIRRFRVVLGVAAITLAIGMVFYHFVEKLRWLDALYFSVVSLLTVGYGDVTPKTDIGKIFTIFYLIMGVGIMGALVNAIIVRAIARREQKRKENIESAKNE